ncbi:MAG: RNA polymerase sigma factor [Actinomycetota bacterium]
MRATRRPSSGFFLMMDDLAKSLATDVDATFPVVVEQMGGMLFSGLRRMCGDHQEAEDLTQETFIRAYRALESYEPERIRDINLRPWLWTIAMNLGRNHLRDRSRRPTYVEMTETGSEDAEPVDSAAWDQRLADLSRNQRIAVILRHVVGMPIAEIAEAIGRPEGTVKADVHRGLTRLRKTLEEEEQ